MPFAIKQKTVIVGRKVKGNTCRIISAQANREVVSFKGDSSLVPGKGWSNYVKGVTLRKPLFSIFLFFSEILGKILPPHLLAFKTV